MAVSPVRSPGRVGCPFWYVLVLLYCLCHALELRVCVLNVEYNIYGGTYGKFCERSQHRTAAEEDNQ